MYSTFIALATFTSFATLNLAMPLRSRETQSTVACHPTYETPLVMTITADPTYEHAWTIFQDDDLRIQNITLRNAHDIYNYTITKYNNNYEATQLNSTNAYTFNSAKVGGVQYCIAAASETETRDAPCDDPLAVWNLDCATCAVESYDTHGKGCFVRSSVFGTCAQLEEDGAIVLSTCKTFDDNVQSTDAGNQAWNVL